MTRFLLAVLVLANIASAIGVVYARHRHRVLFDEVTRLERARDELNVEFGRLQLEQATVAEATRIDQVARVRLGMKFPEAADIVVVRPLTPRRPRTATVRASTCAAAWPWCWARWACARSAWSAARLTCS